MNVSDSPGPLAGLRVVEVSAFVAVPLAGLMLAQLGAEVIRIDPLEGGLDFHRWPVTRDGTSLYWAGLNRGKRSVAINTDDEAGRDLVRRLITAPGAGAGILITNISPRWLAPGDLEEVRPDLISLSLLGRPDGTIAVDYTVNAAVGYPEVTGRPGEVTNHVLPAWDVIAGHTIVSAVVSAELRRRSTGLGDRIELSLWDVAMSTVGNLGHVAEVVVNDSDRPALGNYLYGSFGRDFLTADGRRLMVVAVTDRQWESLVRAAGIDEAIATIERDHGVDLHDEGARFTHRESIAMALESWFAGTPYDTATRSLDHHRVCWGPYRSFREMAAGVLESDSIFSLVDQPGIGTYPAARSPIRMASGTPAAAPAPALGADTSALLTEIVGATPADITSWRNRGLI